MRTDIDKLDLSRFFGELTEDRRTVEGQVLALLSERPMTYSELEERVSFSHEPFKRTLKDLKSSELIGKESRYGKYHLDKPVERVSNDDFLVDEDFIYSIDRMGRAVNPISRRIGPDAMRLFGYYVSEGCDGGSVKISNNDSKIIRDIEECAEEIGLNPQIILRPQDRKEVQVENKAFQTITGQFGHNARDKKIPMWMYEMPEEFQHEFLRGCYLGDGQTELDEDSKRLEIKTVSRELAEGIRMLLHSLGFPTSIANYDSSYTLRLYGPTAKELAKKMDIKMPYNSKRRNLWSVVTDDYVGLKLKDLTTVPYAGPVYNLEVADTHTYNAGGFVAHNCPPGWHRADYSITAKYENVTGNPKYNDLDPQTIHVRHTLFVFKVYERYVDDVEEMILKALGREVE